MLAAACALLAALLAAPAAALAPGSCPALGKGSARTWRPRPPAGWGPRGWRGGEAGAPFLWLAWVPAGTAEGSGRPSRLVAGGAACPCAPPVCGGAPSSWLPCGSELPAVSET